MKVHADTKFLTSPGWGMWFQHQWHRGMTAGLCLIIEIKFADRRLLSHASCPHNRWQRKTLWFKPFTLKFFFVSVCQQWNRSCLPWGESSSEQESLCILTDSQQDSLQQAVPISSCLCCYVTICSKRFSTVVRDNWPPVAVLLCLVV